jgi:hypothetical protein
VKLLVNRPFYKLIAITAFTICSWGNDTAYGAAPPKTRGKAKSSVVSARIDPKKESESASAKSGVSLIELIKQRLRSLPQLAVNNTKQAIASQSQDSFAPPPLIAADPHLLIKPQERQAVRSGYSVQFEASSSAVVPERQVIDANGFWERTTTLPATVNVQHGVSRSPSFTNFDIALIPPTVVSGIAAVRLGSSTKEARQSISSLGQITKQQFDDWMVWSVYQAKAKVGSNVRIDNASSQAKQPVESLRLQIFIQASMVEAIRVFDASLMRPNLSINIGDDLSLIKQKFGEPAFILAEPNLKVSQNYIYPINQIGFQLERQKNEDAPKVKSVLIFNAG